LQKEELKKATKTVERQELEITSLKRK